MILAIFQKINKTFAQFQTQQDFLDAQKIYRY